MTVIEGKNAIKTQEKSTIVQDESNLKQINIKNTVRNAEIEQMKIKELEEENTLKVDEETTMKVEEEYILIYQIDEINELNEQCKNNILFVSI